MKTFAILCLVAAALAAPAAPGAPAQQPGQAGQAKGGAGASCSQAQSALEKGIQQNLDIQAQELKGYVGSNHTEPFEIFTLY